MITRLFRRSTHRFVGNVVTDPIIPDLNRKKLNKLFQVDVGFDGEQWVAVCIYVPEGQGKVLTSPNLKSLMREVSKQIRLRNNDAHRYQFPEQKDKNGGVDRLIVPV